MSKGCGKSMFPNASKVDKGQRYGSVAQSHRQPELLTACNMTQLTIINMRDANAADHLTKLSNLLKRRTTL
jgi:hypothetical protein